MELMTVDSDDLARLFRFQLNENEIKEIIFLYGHYLHGELFFSLLPQTIKLNNTFKTCYCFCFLEGLKNSVIKMKLLDCPVQVDKFWILHSKLRACIPPTLKGSKKGWFITLIRLTPQFFLLGWLKLNLNH